MEMKRLITLVLLVFTLFASGCKEKDTTIRARVEERLSANQETAGTSVSVEDGVATLSGQVQTENGKIESGNIAKETKGVKSVNNQITVAAPVSAPVVVTADDPLTTAVRDATKDHPTVNASVQNGVVTLTGTISKEDNRILMQKINALNPGRVDNQLTVK